MPYASRLLFAEALFVSAYVNIALWFFSFHKVAGWLGQPVPLQPDNAGTNDMYLAAQIRSAVRLGSKYAPWPVKCYSQALTAKIMLKKRKTQGALYFGFLRSNEGEMLGHAWLKCNGIMITGFSNREFEVHSCFI